MVHKNCTVGHAIRFELLRRGALIFIGENQSKRYQLLKDGHRAEFVI